MKPIACDLQDLSPPQAALHLRKRPSRFHILLLFFLASAATFSSRTAFRRNCVLDAAAQTNHTHLAPNNATLLRFLASSESADPYGLAEVDDFLRSVFDGDPSPSPALPSLRRLAGREAAGHKATIRARAARWAPALPAFRRAFLSWSSHRRPDPGPVMSDLPSLLSLPRHHGRCAVVGNSGVLLRGSHGPRIDSHDLVIRLNNARVSGFEAHVGRKTDLSFVNSNVFHVCGHHAGCPCHPYGPGVPLVMYICQAHHLLDYVVCAAASGGRPPPPVLLTDPRLDLLCARILKYYSLKRFTESTGRPPEEWGKVHDAAAFHYSSGMEAVVMALGICEEVSLFGFGKVAGARHHYHTSQMKELSLHDYLAEYDFYDDLVRSPEAVPFLGDFGFKVPPVVIYR